MSLAKNEQELSQHGLLEADIYDTFCSLEDAIEQVQTYIEELKDKIELLQSVLTDEQINEAFPPSWENDDLCDVDSDPVVHMEPLSKRQVRIIDIESDDCESCVEDCESCGRQICSLYSVMNMCPLCAEKEIKRLRRIEAMFAKYRWARYQQVATYQSLDELMGISKDESKEEQS